MVFPIAAFECSVLGSDCGLFEVPIRVESGHPPNDRNGSKADTALRALRATLFQIDRHTREEEAAQWIVELREGIAVASAAVAGWRRGSRNEWWLPVENIVDAEAKQIIAADAE